MLTIQQARQISFLAGLILTAALVAGWITADKTPRRYYVQERVGGLSCVYGGADWIPDQAAFCSSEIDKVLAVQKQLSE
ncbi:MAG TPA: hypothetical protein VMW52_05555 [Phycisphaerae bacterium]|nr:hypothetical protein [Phycisphaerae bacterium]